MPLIAAIVGVASGTITLLLHAVRGYRHVQRLRTQAAVPAILEAHAAAHTDSLAPPPVEATPAIQTPDRRLRVFLSSTVKELSRERAAARRAIARLHPTPVLVELGTRPHPSRDLSRAYLAESDVFVGIYWQSYGRTAPGEDVSDLEDEYLLAGDKPKLMYLKAPAPEQEPRLSALLSRIRADDHVSYKSFTTVVELRDLVANDVALLLTEHFSQLRATGNSLGAPVGSTQTGSDALMKLPIQTTSFVGRETELADVERLIDASRLVTFTGAGGVGKTRLALQVARDTLDQYGDGVWLVQLAPVSQPELVPHLVARAVGVNEQPGQRVLQTVTAVLRTQHLLLILDNCEHLIEACAQTTEELIRHCPNVHVLATSREPLNIDGERTWRVPPLRLPDPERVTGAESVKEYESARLFVDRASASQATFALTDQNAPAVAQICARLDGIPLAIELAAAATKVLTPEQIASRLDQRFALLTHGNRTALQRHQTLRALVDWSHDLLAEQAQVLFRRTSVFAGGWTLDAAEAVCAGEPIAQSDVLELLTTLVDKSLVVSEDQLDGQMRYHLLETLRQYGQERLTAGGDSQAVEQRYAAWFLALAERAEPELRGTHQAMWLGQVEREHDNLRAALRWCVERGHAEQALLFGKALWRFWLMRGHLAEGRERLMTVLQLGGPEQTSESRRAARAAVLVGAGNLAREQGDFADARSLFEESLAISRELGDRRSIAMCVNDMGNLAMDEGDLPAARSLHEEALATWRELDDRRNIGRSLNNLGVVAHRQGDYATARSLLDGSVDIKREFGDQWGIANSLDNLGNVAEWQGDYVAATALYEESLTITRELGDRGHICDTLAGLARVAAMEGHAVRALRLGGAAAKLRTLIGAPLQPFFVEQHHRALQMAEQALSEPARATAWAEGQAMSLEQALEYALGTQLSAPSGAPAPETATGVRSSERR